jgi:peptidoglycan/xylan/chitin deacetylase (PgdA/CDA1 family)
MGENCSMSTQLIHEQAKALTPRAPVTRTLIRTLRTSLRVLGMLAYHLGLAPIVISLSPNRIRTLLYHAVEDQPGSYTAGLGMSISPWLFRQHLDYYQQHYNIASMQDIVAGRAGPRAALLTFDDGYASVGENAIPALQERGLPATIFLIGKAVRGGMIWVNQLNHALNSYPQVAMTIVNSFPGLAHVTRQDAIHHVQTRFSPPMIEQLMAQLEAGLPLQAPPVKLFLDREEVQQLKSRGISFGFHTNDHYNLQLCSEAALRQQLDSSELDDLLDSRTFAYPFGYCGDREADRLEAHGFERAMLVKKDTSRPRKTHMKRSEPTGQSAADVFAQLEVVEPLMNFLRSVVR